MDRLQQFFFAIYSNVHNSEQRFPSDKRLPSICQPDCSGTLLRTGAFGCQYAVLWWSSILLGVAQQFAPVGKMSLLHSCLVENQLLSLRLAYYGNILRSGAKEKMQTKQIQLSSQVPTLLRKGVGFSISFISRLTQRYLLRNGFQSRFFRLEKWI